jgi:hypothetical protein
MHRLHTQLMTPIAPSVRAASVLRNRAVGTPSITGIGIAPIWWTPRALSREVFSRCPRHVLHTPLSSAGRWSSWSVPAAIRLTSLASSNPRVRPSRTGSRSLTASGAAAAAERTITIYAGPSGIAIPASALATAPAQPVMEASSVAENTQPLTIDEAGETRRAIVVHTASTVLR